MEVSFLRSRRFYQLIDRVSHTDFTLERINPGSIYVKSDEKAEKDMSNRSNRELKICNNLGKHPQNRDEFILKRVRDGG